MFTYLLVAVLGLPQLTSSIGSQLFGEHCPGSVTLTCNTFDFGTDGLIDWYINDTLLARYTYKANHKFPLAVMVQNSLKAVAQISSSSFINGQFNFENFTLSVDLDDLLPFQGQNITCGSFGERSNVFNINKFVGKIMLLCGYMKFIPFSHYAMYYAMYVVPLKKENYLLLS